MTVAEWRKKHKRCEFCKHLRLILAPPMCLGDVWECKAKAKCVDPLLPRPFCRLFQLEEGE